MSSAPRQQRVVHGAHCHNRQESGNLSQSSRPAAARVEGLPCQNSPPLCSPRTAPTARLAGNAAVYIAMAASPPAWSRRSSTLLSLLVLLPLFAFFLYPSTARFLAFKADMRCLTVALPLIAAANAANIVLTNDDGWAETNIRTTFKTLSAAGHNVILSGPAENQSGRGMQPPALPLCQLSSQKLFPKGISIKDHWLTSALQHRSMPLRPRLMAMDASSTAVHPIARRLAAIQATRASTMSTRSLSRP